MDFLRNVSSAIALRCPPPLRKQNNLNAINLSDIPEVQEVKLLATGGYNSVWLVKLHQPFKATHPTEKSLTFRNDLHNSNSFTQSEDTGSPVDRFILRLPIEDALLPNQVENDVAFKKFVATKLPHIPVPKVYLYHATRQPETSFIVEEYIDCPPLSSTWMSLTPTEKDNVAQKLAAILVDLSEVSFDKIGGLNPVDFSLAPTVEGCKLFKGRGKFHRTDCYPIGPYKTTKEYILSTYEREIHYYSHATDDIDSSLFDDVSVQEFVEELRKKQEDLADANIVDEPFVLVHGDFHGRNILARGDQITAVIDWEFAGSYPLSEALSGGDVDVIDPDTEELDEENTKWGLKIRQYIQHEVTKRNWDQNRVDLFMGDGDPELGEARVEMFPL
ncbi:kinase-like domain-containing protein [Xylaria arbuscula]|nr:kinase-like domain-containing protein [Xylaria arbuscula]